MQDPLRPFCVAAENKLIEVFRSKYNIRLDHKILSYPQALYNDLVIEETLAPASQVVKGSDSSKLN